MKEELLREVSGWIRNWTLDPTLVEKQVSRFSTLYGFLKEGITHFWFR